MTKETAQKIEKCVDCGKEYKKISLWGKKNDLHCTTCKGKRIIKKLEGGKYENRY